MITTRPLHRPGVGAGPGVIAHSGHPLLEGEHRGDVEVAETLLLGGGEHRVGALGDGHRHARLLRLAQHERHVLAHQPEFEGRELEIALPHDRAAKAHHRRAVAALGDHLQHLLARQPGAFAEHDRLGRARHLDPHQHIEDQLHRRAHAALAEIGHLLAEHLQQRLDRPEVLLLAAGHDPHLALAGVHRVAEHAGVERVVAGLGRARRDLPGKVGRHGTHVEDVAALLERLEHPVGVEQHPRDDLLVGEAEHHYIGLARRVRGRVGDTSAEPLDFLSLCARAVVDSDVIPRLDQPAGHAVAHHTEADERDPLLVGG